MCLLCVVHTRYGTLRRMLLQHSTTNQQVCPLRNLQRQRSAFYPQNCCSVSSRIINALKRRFAESRKAPQQPNENVFIQANDLVYSRLICTRDFASALQGAKRIKEGVSRKSLLGVGGVQRSEQIEAINRVRVRIAYSVAPSFRIDVAVPLRLVLLSFLFISGAYPILAMELQL